MSFKNKVVLVTGASSGIGAATAVAFAKEGADVAIVGRNETKLAAVEKRCKSHGIAPLVIKADVSKDEDVKRIIKSTIDQFGKLDVLVSNAGITEMGCIMDGKLVQAYDKVVATNFRPAMLLATLAAPYLVKTVGNIVNISSRMAQIGPIVPLHLPYSVTKAALNHFSQSIAAELAPFGIRVNVISPGPVYTDILENSNTPRTFDDLKNCTALNRVSQPEEIADLVLYLAGEKAIGITGSIIVTDNGALLKR